MYSHGMARLQLQTIDPDIGSFRLAVLSDDQTQGNNPARISGIRTDQG